MNIDVRSGPGQRRRSRAARFPASQSSLVAKAAKAMNLAVCTAEGAVLAELAKEVAERPVVRDRPWLRPVSGAQSVRQDRHPGRELLRPWQSFLAT
jgi:hypothetical protein